MTEEWRPVSKVTGYEVSSLGRVRSVDRIVETANGQRRRYRGKIVSQASKNQYGHRKVMLHAAGVTVMAYVHILVAEAFIGPTPAGMQVSHRDGNPDHNWCGNLRHATPLQNSADMVDHGTRLQGESHPCAKLTATEVIEIRRRLADGESQYTVAAYYGRPRATIASIDQRKSWKSLCAS